MARVRLRALRNVNQHMLYKKAQPLRCSCVTIVLTEKATFLLTSEGFVQKRMAYALVQWKDDQRISVIPAKWILSPSVIPEDLPVEGECYWKRKGSRYRTEILAISGKLLFTPCCG